MIQLGQKAAHLHNLNDNAMRIADMLFQEIATLMHEINTYLTTLQQETLQQEVATPLHPGIALADKIKRLNQRLQKTSTIASALQRLSQRQFESFTNRKSRRASLS